MRLLIGGLLAVAVTIRPLVCAAADGEYPGLRAQAAVEPIQGQASDNKPVFASLARIRDRFEQHVSPGWSSKVVIGALRTTTYTSAKLLGIIPVLGSMIEDLEESGWERIRASQDEELVEYISREVDFGIRNGTLGKDLGKLLIDKEGELRRVDAWGVILQLVGAANPRFFQLNDKVRDQVQNAAIEYLARAVDGAIAAQQVSSAEIRALRERVNEASERLASLERTQSEGRKARGQFAERSKSLQQKAGEALAASNSKAAENSDAESRAFFVKGMLTTSEQAGMLANGLAAFGHDTEARAVTKLAAAAKLAAGIAASIANPLAILPTFQAAGELFGRQRASYVNEALRELMAAVVELDRKVDLYHSEVAARLKAIAVALGEVLKATEFLAKGGAAQCADWLATIPAGGKYILVSRAYEARVPGSVADFAPLFALDRSGIRELLSRQQRARACLGGLPGSLAWRGEEYNPALHMPLSRGEAPGLAERFEAVDYLNTVWQGHRKFIRTWMGPEGRQQNLVLRPSMDLQPGTEHFFSSEAQQLFEGSERLLNFPSIVRSASYAAAVHYLYAFEYLAVSDTITGPRKSHEGHSVAADALVVTEAALGQLHALFAGPIAQMAGLVLLDDIASMYPSKKCVVIPVACEVSRKAYDFSMLIWGRWRSFGRPHFTDKYMLMKKELSALLRHNPGLNANVGLVMAGNALAENGRSFLSYRFAYEQARSAGTPLALSVLFRGSKLSSASRVIWSKDLGGWVWEFPSVSVPLPDPQFLEEGRYALPPVYYQLVRVARQLAVETGTYTFIVNEGEWAPLKAAMAAGVFPP